MAGMKMEALIAAQIGELRATVNADIAALINALDDMLMPLETRIDELAQRVTKLEEGVNP
jgi:hypothetical protein